MFYINLFNNFYFYGEKKNIHLICIYFWEISVVNAVLLKVRHINCISPGFNQSMIQFEQDTIHTATILWLNNTTTWARSRLAINVNTDTSNQLINISTRTRSTWLQYCELSIRSIPILKVLNLHASTKPKLLYTVIKAEL